MKTFSLRLSFTAKIYISLLLIFAVSLASTGIVAWVIAGDQAMSRAERAIDESLQRAEFSLEQEQADLSTLGQWLANQDEFIALVRARDSVGLTRMLEPLTLTGVIDVIEVTDPGGQVIIRVQEYKPVTQGDNIANQSGVTEALSGKSTNWLEPDEYGQLRGRLTLPIYEDAAKPSIGALIVGFYLDGSFLQRMSDGVANQALVVYDDRIAIANVSDPVGSAWVGQAAPEEALQAEHEGRPSGIVPLESGSSKYFFKFRPLHFPASVPAGIYGVGIPSAAVESDRLELFRALGLWILLIAVGVSGLSYLLARTLTAPIHRLQSAARGIAGGNVSEPVVLVRDDELGDLAEQIETIRARWRDALEPAAVETKPIVCGEMMLDPRSHQVTVAGKAVMLSATEFKLVQYLMTNRDTVISVPQIIVNVWGYAAHEDDDLVRMTISRLRKKIERNPSQPSMLVTVPGAGYLLKSKV